MKVVALLVQPSGVEWEWEPRRLAEVAARLPGLIAVDPAAGFSAWPAFPPPAENLTTAPAAAPGKTLREMERQFLEQVLAECHGNKSAAAKTLKMHRRTLQRKLARSA